MLSEIPLDRFDEVRPSVDRSPHRPVFPIQKRRAEIFNRRIRDRHRKLAGAQPTNAIESTNFQLHKITKNRGHFPDKDAAIKLIYLGLHNISSQRRGYSGTGTHNWTVVPDTLARL